MELWEKEEQGRKRKGAGTVRQNCYSHGPCKRVCLNGWVQGPGTGVRAPGLMGAESRVWWCPDRKEASLGIDSPCVGNPSLGLIHPKNSRDIFHGLLACQGVSSIGHLAHPGSLFWSRKLSFLATSIPGASRNQLGAWRDDSVIKSTHHSC